MHPVAEMPFDAQNFIPFDHTFTAGERSHLDRAGVGGDLEMTDEGVPGLSQAGGYNLLIQLFGANNWLTIRSGRSVGKAR